MMGKCAIISSMLKWTVREGGMKSKDHGAVPVQSCHRQTFIGPTSRPGYQQHHLWLHNVCFTPVGRPLLLCWDSSYLLRFHLRCLCSWHQYVSLKYFTCYIASHIQGYIISTFTYISHTIICIRCIQPVISVWILPIDYLPFISLPTTDIVGAARL